MHAPAVHAPAVHAPAVHAPAVHAPAVKAPAVNGRSMGADANRSATGQTNPTPFDLPPAGRLASAPSDLPFTAGHAHDGLELSMNNQKTRHQKVGQMLLFGWKTDAQADALVTEFAAGGIILMGRNIKTPAETASDIAHLQSRARQSSLPPLFVAVDQEGGRVQRLGPPHYPKRPSQREVGASSTPNAARVSAQEIGTELKSLGFNWDFAPVLDVDSSPQNPVIGDRAYSSDPQTVAALGVAAVAGFQDDARILACGKHFPGHGDTDTDSHFALPTIRRSRAALDAVELVPFRAAIEAGVAAIMTAHILFPALDPALPATLSPTILTGLLREELGFNGLIITDDLEMKGVANGWGAPEAAVLAVEAGTDLLLCCHEWETQRAIHAALLTALDAGRLTEARLDQSLARIAAAKAQWLPIS